MIKMKMISILGSLMIAYTASADIIDPIRHFINTFSITNTSEIIMVKNDINGDEKDEIFLTQQNSWYNGRDGKMWCVYISTSNGYKCAREIISFRTDASIFAIDPESGKKALFTYFPDNPGNGTYVKIHVNDKGEIQAGSYVKVKNRKLTTDNKIIEFLVQHIHTKTNRVSLLFPFSKHSTTNTITNEDSTKGKRN